MVAEPELLDATNSATIGLASDKAGSANDRFG